MVRSLSSGERTSPRRCSRLFWSICSRPKSFWNGGWPDKDPDGTDRKRKRKAKSRSFLFQKRKVKAGAPKGDKGCTGRKFCKEGRKKSGFFLFCFGNPQSGNPTSIFREEAASIRQGGVFSGIARWIRYPEKKWYLKKENSREGFPESFPAKIVL